MSHEPDTDTKRSILEEKLRQYKAKAYDHAVTARIAERLGSEAEATKARTRSERLYDAARETEAILDELGDDE